MELAILLVSFSFEQFIASLLDSRYVDMLLLTKIYGLPKLSSIIWIIDNLYILIIKEESDSVIRRMKRELQYIN